MADPHTPPRRSRAAIALIAIGLLVLVPSSLCSAFFSIAFLKDALTATGEAAAYARGFIWLVPMFGGPSIVLVALLLRLASSPQDRPTAGATLLMAIGFFLLIPFSVCTAVSVWLVATAIYNHDAIDYTGDISEIVRVLLKTIPLILIVGGLPIALGVLLLRKGLKLLRRTIPPVR